MTTALILFAHGARDPEWASPMRRVQAILRQLRPGLRVELAFLEFMVPDLPACIAGLVADGASKILIMPMFIARGGHLKRDVPEMLARLRPSWPTVELVLAGVVGEQEAVVRAMAEATLKEAGL
jgi:sirohydrochlorin cobaltochelatase